MKELIEIDKLKKWRADRIQSGNCSYDDMTALEAFIETVERVDRPQGEWKASRNNIGHKRFECSVCGGKQPYRRFDFCPNCGARMKGADDEV